jgi:hypothetical protein
MSTEVTKEATIQVAPDIQGRTPLSFPDTRVDALYTHTNPAIASIPIKGITNNII